MKYFVVTALMGLVVGMNAAAVNPAFLNARDVTIGPPVQDTSIPTSPSNSPNTTSTNTLIPPTTLPPTTSSENPSSTRILIPPTTRPLIFTSSPTDPTPIPPATKIPSSSSSSSSFSQPPNLSAVCKAMVSSIPALTNYTQPYSCSMTADLPVFAMYYDSCGIVVGGPQMALASAAAARPVGQARDGPANPFGPAFTNRPSSSASPSPPAPPPDTATAPVSPPPPPPSQNPQPAPPPPLSSNATTYPPTTLCCDPTFNPYPPSSPSHNSYAYTMPTTFDTLCVWGNATSIGAMKPGEWDSTGVPKERPGGVGGVGRCMVSPVIRPMARCVQVPVGFD